MVDDVVHYCVANMPGAVARTSAAALNNATLPYVLELANKGVGQALRANVHLLQGLNVHHGKVTNQFVGEAHGLSFIEPERPSRHSSEPVNKKAAYLAAFLCFLPPIVRHSSSSSAARVKISRWSKGLDTL